MRTSAALRFASMNYRYRVEQDYARFELKQRTLSLAVPCQRLTQVIADRHDTPHFIDGRRLRLPATMGYATAPGFILHAHEQLEVISADTARSPPGHARHTLRRKLSR